IPLVNAHTHLEQTWLAPYCPPVTGDSFPNWISHRLEAAKRAVGDQREKAVREGIETGIQMLLDSGTTTVGDISATGWSIGPLLASGLSGIIWVEVMAFTPQHGDERLNRARALIEQWRPHERNGLRLGLTLHTPYSLLPPYLKLGLEYARGEALPLCLHAAESAEEHEWFRHGTGPLAELSGNRRILFPSPHISPIRYLEESGVLDLRPLLVHTVQVDDDDIERIRRSGSAVVHCPRSNLRLRCGRMPLEKFLAAGVPVYLGTDSLGSSPSLSVQDEIEVAVALHWDQVSPAEIAALAHRPLI
ncbi:MAG: amidohydrolase family protein, partial [Anaerolineae bacterium]|nr:amidohydrolase family protein [Anaerolineae bacterium]